MTHEEAFVATFLESAKRARFIQFLSNRRRRAEILEKLNHGLPYLAALAQAVPPECDFPEELERLLKAKGAGPTCHVIANRSKADGRELPLGEALKMVCLHEFGAILSCVPGRLVYYKPQVPGQGIILEKPPK